MHKLTRLKLITSISIFAFIRAASGHGFVLTLDGNQIQATSQAPTLSPHLFVGDLDQFSDTVFFADHGGVQAGSGFSVPSDTFALEFQGPLWFSHGDPATRAPPGMALHGTSYDSFGAPLGTVNIMGTTVDHSGFPVVGNDSHSIGWILSANAIASGAYGFSYRVLGLKNGDPQIPFVASAPLAVVFETPDFVGTANAPLAEQAIFQALLQGDFNRDGHTTDADIPAMLSALTDMIAYQERFELPDADLLAIADLDRSGQVTNADIQGLLDLLTSDIQPQTVSEPASFTLVFVALTLCSPFNRRRAHGLFKS